MKIYFLFLSISVFANDKVALPEDFGVWECGTPAFTKLGKCEIHCDQNGCKVLCREKIK